MTTIANADRMPLADLQRHIAHAWREQRAHVAENSPFYQASWQGRTLPEDLRDLPELPLSDKSQLRLSQAQHSPFGDYLAAPLRTANRLHRTSGTTGQAMNLALGLPETRGLTFAGMFPV